MFTTGVGETVIVNVWLVPVHVPITGETIIEEVIAAFVAFVPVNEAISPIPLATNPVAVLSFVQLKEAPDVPENVTVLVDCPEQIV